MEDISDQFDDWSGFFFNSLLKKPISKLPINILLIPQKQIQILIFLFVPFSSYGAL